MKLLFFFPFFQFKIVAKNSWDKKYASKKLYDMLIVFFVKEYEFHQEQWLSRVWH